MLLRHPLYAMSINAAAASARPGASARGHKQTFRMSGQCPFYSQKRTSLITTEMSALCQWATSDRNHSKSGEAAEAGGAAFGWRWRYTLKRHLLVAKTSRFSLAKCPLPSRAGGASIRCRLGCSFRLRKHDQCPRYRRPPDRAAGMSPQAMSFFAVTTPTSLSWISPWGKIAWRACR